MSLKYEPASEPLRTPHPTHQGPRVELLDTSRGVLKELDPPIEGEGVSTVVSQLDHVVLDYMVYLLLLFITLQPRVEWYTPVSQ